MNRTRTSVLLGGALLLLGIFALLFLPHHSIEISGSPAQPTVSPSYTLLFTGDIMLGRNVYAQIEKAQDPLYPFLKIADTLRASDLTIGNLEGPISDRGERVGSIYSFRFEPVGAINALTYGGFDVLSLANNHIWDYGRVALLDTVSHLKAAGILSAGAGSDYASANAPAFAHLGDATIAFLSITNLYPSSLAATATSPGISDFDLGRISSQIKDIKDSGAADLVVVLFHGGEEYKTAATDDQKFIAHSVIDAGADLFIGTHPHVAEEIEQYRGKYIAYSLGNFVFDQYFSKETMEGLMAKATIKDKKVQTFESIPIKLTDTFQPYVIY